MVIRLLEQTAKLKNLSELGMPAGIEHSFHESIQRSHGLILGTGPMGFGKTTTLYSASPSSIAPGRTACGSTGYSGRIGVYEWLPKRVGGMAQQGGREVMAL